MADLDVAAIRTKLKMTRSQFALAINVDVQSVYRWENQLKQPSERIALRILELENPNSTSSTNAPESEPVEKKFEARLVLVASFDSPQGRQTQQNILKILQVAERCGFQLVEQNFRKL